MMASSSALSAAGLDVCNLRQIVMLDMAASNELQKRIDQVRYELKGGKSLPEATVQTMENLSKDMTKDLVNRIEKIERSGTPTPVDREMLQALSARLAVCDRQGMQLAELRDLERELSRERENARLAKVSLPLGGTPRQPSRTSTLYTPEGSPPMVSNIPPPPPYGAQFNSNTQSEVPVFMPPPTSPAWSSNPSLERTSSQTQQQRHSWEIRRDHIYPNSSPPPQQTNNTSPILPSPQPRNLPGQPPCPRIPSTFPYHRNKFPSDVRRNASFPTPTSSNQTSSPSSSSSHPLPTTTTPHPQGESQFYSYADYSDDSESDFSLPTSQDSKTSWPFLYRILDIDPSTDPDVLLLVAKRELERLSLRHNPARVGGGDPGAEKRWEAINTAYDILTHPERKRMYDAGGGDPVEALGVNLDELRV